MAKRKPAQEEDFGFVPLESEEDFGFTPEESAAAESKMAKAAFPTMEIPEEDVGFVPYSPEFLQDQKETPVSLEEIGQTAEDVLTTMPQGLTSWMDEIQAAAQAGGKKLMGAEDPFMDIYQQDVSKIRENIGKARERSPWATALGETGIGVASSLVPVAGPLGKAASVLSAGKLSGMKGALARGAFEGMGVSSSMDPWELGLTGGAGALGAGVSSVAGQALKGVSSQDPNKIRAAVLGAKTSQFKEIGIKDRADIAKELNKIGLFQKFKTKFNADTLKWEPVGTKLENIQTPTRDNLLSRVNEAFEETQKLKTEKFQSSLNNPINKITLAARMMNAADEWADKQTGVPERKQLAERIIQSLLVDLENDSNTLGYTVGALEKTRVRLKNDVGNYGKNPLLANINDVESLYKDLYTQINNTLNDSIEDKAYKNINLLQNKLYTVKADLQQSIAAEPPAFKLTDVKSWGKSPESMLDKAEWADIMQKPGLKQLQKPAALGVSELPYSILRFLDPSIPAQESNFRMPQSTVGLTPRQLVDYRIPRSTQAIMESKDKVLAKLVQKGIPDEMIETATMALNGDGDDVSNIMPLIMTQMPELFEKSKYKVFDGKFLDPNDRAKAADDISKRDDLNSIERARMINRINKTGEVPEGM